MLCAPFIRDKAVVYIALALPALFIDPLPIGGRIEVFKITVGLRGEVYLRDVYRVEIRHELSVDRRAADNEAALIFCRQRQRLPGAVRDLRAGNFDILPGDDDVVPTLERPAAGDHRERRADIPVGAAVVLNFTREQHAQRGRPVAGVKIRAQQIRRSADDDGRAVRQLLKVSAVGLEHDGLSPAAADAPV